VCQLIFFSDSVYEAIANITLSTPQGLARLSWPGYLTCDLGVHWV